MTPNVSAQAWQRMLAPKTIAIIGASRNPASRSALIENGLRGGGFEGKVYRVNPRRGASGRGDFVASLAAIPEPVDLGLILLPYDAAVEAVAECARSGTGACVVYAAVPGDAAAANADIIQIDGKPRLTDPMFELWLQTRGLTPADGGDEDSA